ncbi:MAG: radical SAM protein [Candidatus Verstraetearchaeota archaeon]|nr:radical SAM protein [Candidatus Verstraetearchaeota archaeon]
MATYSYAKCKSVISKSRLPGLEYTFNPYVGCGHGCLYCYVPDLMRGRFDRWPARVAVKESVLEKLRSEIERLKPGIVGISTSTDPYQPLEAELMIVRGALELFRDAKFPVSIQTKSPLVLRDLDLLRVMDAEVGFTITSHNKEFRDIFEPGAPDPSSRLRALEGLSEAGIRTWIFYGPIIPGFNDSEEEICRIVGEAARTRSKVLYDKINLKPLVRLRLRSAIPEDNMRAISLFDYGELYRKIEKCCIERGVSCSPAF